MHRFMIELVTLLSLLTCIGITDGQREKRFLPFTESATVGLIAAVATPLDLPNREVFFSYNFEANYNEPDPYFFNYPLVQYGIGRSGLDGLQNSTGNSIHHHTHNGKKPKKKTVKEMKKAEEFKNTTRRLKRSLLSRKTVYRIFEEKLVAFGYNGRSCLLKAICQASDTPLGNYNGVLGDIVHVIFTPSSSRDDGISKEYYEAEYYGNLGDCSRYSNRCPKSFFEFISIIK